VDGLTAKLGPAFTSSTHNLLDGPAWLNPEVGTTTSTIVINALAPAHGPSSSPSCHRCAWWVATGYMIAAVAARRIAMRY
jgi:hypothetical protein